MSIYHIFMQNIPNVWMSRQQFVILQRQIRQMKSDTAKQVIDAFSQSVESHRNGAEPNDDLTMLAIRCLG